MTYTESQIRELSGRELDVAFEWLVLGDDLTANTEERLHRAVQSYRYGDVNFPLDLVQFEHVQHTYRRDKVSWEWARWLCRFGMTYQSAIEQYVANWRAEPRPMPLDWLVPHVLGLGGVLEGWCFFYLSGLSKWCCEDPDPISPTYSSNGPDDPETAIKRAACLVAMKEE